MPKVKKEEPLPGFPKCAGLIYPDQNKGFAIWYYKPFPMEETRSVDTGDDPKIRVEYEAVFPAVNVPIFNAVLLVAPYVRILQEVSERFMKRFRRAKLFLSVDGCRILWHSPVRHHLAAPKDRRLDDYPFDLDMDSGCGFPAARMSDDGMNIFRDDVYGVFLLNGSIVQVMVAGIPGGEGKIRLETGCVAVEYTTREAPGPKDWTPRPDGFMIRRKSR